MLWVCFRFLGHLYAAEALISLDRISDAIAHLNPENVTDVSLGVLTSEQDQGQTHTHNLSLSSYGCNYIPAINAHVFCFLSTGSDKGDDPVESCEYTLINFIQALMISYEHTYSPCVVHIKPVWRFTVMENDINDVFHRVWCHSVLLANPRVQSIECNIRFSRWLASALAATALVDKWTANCCSGLLHCGQEREGWMTSMMTEGILNTIFFYGIFLCVCVLQQGSRLLCVIRVQWAQPAPWCSSTWAVPTAWEASTRRPASACIRYYQHTLSLLLFILLHMYK